jgi:hypothetical protein
LASVDLMNAGKKLKGGSGGSPPGARESPARHSPRRCLPKSAIECFTERSEPLASVDLINAGKVFKGGVRRVSPRHPRQSGADAPPSGAPRRPRRYEQAGDLKAGKKFKGGSGGSPPGARESPGPARPQAARRNVRSNVSKSAASPSAGVTFEERSDEANGWRSPIDAARRPLDGSVRW